MKSPAWISLGSNLGDRKGTLDAALAALDATPGVVVRAVSSYHETRPVGGPAGQGAFLNAAAKLETTLDPSGLLGVTQDVEDRLGRVREVRWGERTLDVDILVYACKYLDTPELSLPHPRLAFRRFVLAPLVEIAPWVLDFRWHRTARELLANLDRKPRLVIVDGPAGPLKSAVFRGLVEQLPASGVAHEEASRLVGSAVDRLTASVRDFARRAEALRLELWARAEASDRWIVVGYHLAAEPEPTIERGEPEFGPGTARRAEALEAVKEWRMIREAGPYLIPTFLVTLPGSANHIGRPQAGPPRLRPESADPAAIVAEVIATCRGIEAI